MEHSTEENAQDLHDLAAGDSENSRLVNPPTKTKMNILNVINNIGCVVFSLYIFYLSFKDGATLFSFHPTCMAIGWLVLMISAINSVTPGDAATEWMPTKSRTTRHWILQSLALIILIIGFTCIVANKIYSDKYHFTTYHSLFGLLSFILALVAACGGVTALYSLQFKKFITPLYIKLIHGAAGLVTYFLGMITIMLGLYSDWWKSGDIVRYICLFILLIITVLTVLRPSIKMYVRIRERITYIRSSN